MMIEWWKDDFYILIMSGELHTKQVPANKYRRYTENTENTENTQR